MSHTASIVVGLGFGDEGKGLVTDYLCSRSTNPLVVRFNGGQQAGHTVCMPDGRRHVFSSFGAGTLRGAATYWSAYCTCAIPALLNEYQALEKLGATPQLYVDENCAVTTHYDALYNRLQEQQRGNSRHGSCGMGFGNTVQRQLAGVSFTAKDLLRPNECAKQLLHIRNYYQQKALTEFSLDFNAFDHNKEDDRFMDNLVQFHFLQNHSIFIITEEAVFKNRQWNHYVFEGAQGILLDMDAGYFPHVTRSNTTSKNALEIINRNKENFSSVEIYYVSRAYHTRHGEGPFVANASLLQLVNNQDETNIYNNHQGNFRTGPLDINQVQYALQADDNVSTGIPKNLMITCTDQVETNNLMYTYNQQLQSASVFRIPELLQHPFKQVFVSSSPCSEGLVKA